MSLPFFSGPALRDEDFSLGSTYGEIAEKVDFNDAVSVQTEQGTYEFQLDSDDLRMRPLIQAGDTFLQLYFDRHTDRLSSVRMMNKEVLVRLKPYSITYRGNLAELTNYSENEWKEIEAGREKQIFDLTNVIRARHGLEPFDWDEDVSKVAYAHSKDMNEHQFFSHHSPQSGDLSARLEKGNVIVHYAGENIAAHYIDGLAAVEGWLNSEGHRVNLLHEEFTFLGVGVFRDYYTQNFMTPWIP